MSNIKAHFVASAGRSFLATLIISVIGAAILILFNDTFQPHYTTSPEAWRDHMKNLYLIAGAVGLICIITFASGCISLIKCEKEE